MANTYTQINIQAVFAVQGNENTLTAMIRPKVFGYMSGIIKGLGLFPLAVNGFDDHVHVFFELPPDVSVSKVLQEIKSNSSRWINQQKFFEGVFRWQRGFGAFSYSRSHRDSVIKYIMNQENHHKKIRFQQEYLDYLKKYEVEYDEKYVFTFYD